MARTVQVHRATFGQSIAAGTASNRISGAVRAISGSGSFG